MKVKFFFFICLFFLFNFSSCSFFYSDDAYKSVEEIDHILNKTTIANFEHLKEPIVITMPVYENRYRDKRKKYGRSVRVGDIFVVIDVETNSVFDWVYFGGETNLTYWRPVELGSNPKKYYTTCFETGNVACLRPDDENVKIIKTNMKDSHLYSLSSPGDYFIKSSFKNNDICVFDAKKDVLKKPISILQGACCPMYNGIPDENGDLWLVEGDDYVNTLIKIDCLNNKKILQPIKFSSYPKGKEGKDDFFSYYKVFLVTPEYVFIDKSKYDTSILLYDREKQIITKKINLNFDNDEEWLSDIIKVNDKIYMVSGNWDDKYAWINFYQIDVENGKVNLLNKRKTIAFDYTENYWIRGDRIYFMSSRDKKKVVYAYFDTSKNKFAPKSEWQYVMYNNIVK